MNFRRIFCLAVCFFMALGMSAQKKEISAAKDNIKKKTDFDKVEVSMRKLLTDSANKQNVEIWTLLFESVKRQYEQGNEKLYLKQVYDTASLFNNTLKLFQIAEGLDSIDAKPDKKGKIRLYFRKENSSFLNLLRPNLFNGGLYSIRKQKYSDGYDMMNTYIGCATQPLFRNYKYGDTDIRLSEAAYWSVYCGYKMGDAKKTLHNTYLALKDTLHYKFMLQYLAETYKNDADTTRYLEALTEGFNKYPKFPYFFPRLMDFYGKNGRHNEALALADKALKVDSADFVFRFAKSTAMLNLGRYGECINICNSLIADSDTIADVFYNIGLAYFNRAVKLDKTVRLDAKQKERVIRDYRAACPYLEKYRLLMPNQKDMWALPLYTIYLNLNMGEKFDEIDKIVK